MDPRAPPSPHRWSRTHLHSSPRHLISLLEQLLHLLVWRISHNILDDTRIRK